MSTFCRPGAAAGSAETVPGCVPRWRAAVSANWVDGNDVLLDFEPLRIRRMK